MFTITAASRTWFRPESFNAGLVSLDSVFALKITERVWCSLRPSPHLSTTPRVSRSWIMCSPSPSRTTESGSGTIRWPHWHRQRTELHLNNDSVVFCRAALLLKLSRSRMTLTAASVCSRCRPQIIEEDASLVEIGPRFVLNLIKIFQGSFGGPTLYENPHFQSPNTVSVLSLERRRLSAAASLYTDAAFDVSAPADDPTGHGRQMEREADGEGDPQGETQRGTGSDHAGRHGRRVRDSGGAESSSGGAGGARTSTQ